MPIYALDDEVPHVDPSAFVHPEATLIGEVHLGAHSSVWPGVVIRADNGPVYIGARTSIQDGTVIHTQPGNPTRVGDDCTVGHLVHLEGCLVEDHVLVGSGSMVLGSAVCRTVSLVGAGAVVTPRMEVPSHAMALGVPAKLRLDVVTMEMVAGNVQGYLRHSVQHRTQMRRVSFEEATRRAPERGF
jgi:carbonic anhydrase/acetyltransferase-like protein (isoleucine patch superfamily)